MPNFAACHHCMRRIWSAVGAVELSTACATGVAAAVPVSASPAREAPVPSSICRLFKVTFCIQSSPIGLSLQIEESAAHPVLSSGDKGCLITAEIERQHRNLARLRHPANGPRRVKLYECFSLFARKVLLRSSFTEINSADGGAMLGGADRDR